MAAQKSVEGIKHDLVNALAPMEGSDKLFIITDHRTGARYCDCHVRGSKFVELATPDAPLDPDEQADYRANREVVSNALAFAKMKFDAKARRSFSGIVAEYSHDNRTEKPLLIIGGQHRYYAIKEALEAGVDEWHGVKIYLDLTTEQRLDAQLISNTVITISTDLFDRMHETVAGPQLRDWCQSIGLLDPGEDFADRKSRGAVTVQTARTFIVSYYAGTKVPSDEFHSKETLPPITVTGQHDTLWDAVKAAESHLWTDAELKRAGQEFARLVAAQRKAFESKKPKPPVDYPEKASNMALLSAWAFVAGVLRSNAVRLQRHYAIADANGHDPLNVSELVRGRHKTDTDQYRGLGYRTDAKERGRFAELFFLQAVDGSGITRGNINVAIMKYHAKQAQLEVEKEMAKNARANG